MGKRFPHSCKASHLNVFLGAPPSWTSQPLLALRHLLTPYTPAEKAGLARARHISTEGMGYVAIQSSKPQTLGYSLADSPVGLLAWILEKLHDWSDAYPWTEDEVLTWVSIYWFSAAGGPAPSVQIYYEAMHSPEFRVGQESWNGDVKLGISHFPKEIGPLPKLWARTLGPIVYEKVNESGGHFAAWERPESIVEDLRIMFGKVGAGAGGGGGAYGVVKGRDGY
ncbi:MAG: hypothetical protein Q9190_005875 [Brigantiaea leucoxantha]